MGRAVARSVLLRTSFRAKSYHDISNEGHGRMETLAAPQVKRVKVKMPSSLKRKIKRARRPRLSLDETDRLRRKVRRATCTSPWEDVATKEADEQGIQPLSTRVPELLEKWQIYPPPAEHTPMASCICTGCRGIRMWPRAYIGSRGISYECGLERMTKSELSRLPSSPGVIDMARMKSAHRRGEQYP